MWNLQATGSEGIGSSGVRSTPLPDERSLLQARLLYGYASVADTVDPFGYDAAGRGLELATELGADRLRSLLLALVAVGKFFTGFQQAWDLTEEGRLPGRGDRRRHRSRRQPRAPVRVARAVGPARRAAPDARGRHAGPARPR